MDEKMHGRPTTRAEQVDAFSKLHTAHRYRKGQSARSAVKARFTRRERHLTRAQLRAGR